MSSLSRVLIAGSAFLLVAAAEQPRSREMLGFSPEHARQQQELESRFDSFLKAEHLRERMKRLSARPHHLGSAYGKENAQFIASQFRSWGFDTHIEEFKVLFPTPKTRLLELVEPERFKASLQEPALKQDSTSGQKAEQLPTYNAYSADGDVTGNLVYVNYGVPDDYQELARRGIDVKGKIVIARYGGSWRGIKPKVAAEHGAIGCILYSDPRDDGYFQGDVYPGGAYRGPAGVQRGSVEDMPLYPGDPLTPGIGATEDAKRLSLEKAATLTRIPVLPISYSDAQPFLKALAGPVAPEKWRGALPLTYHLGPGPAKVHLKVESNWNRVPAYDVIARLDGSRHPDEWIVRGNHHDAWVNGADDPISGLVAMMEEARALGELVRSGWHPARTIIYAAWDGEEPGLIGSTEWAETHAADLSRHAVAYINSDSNGRGFLGVGGSHTLEKFINQVARDVQDPEMHVSVAERARALRLVRGSAEARKEAENRSDLRIGALGSGSDYTPFLQHLGIASLNIGFGGEDRGGSYHSIYDSFDHYTRFGDPTFEYGVALAQVGGRTVMRLADSDLLPFQFGNFADTLSGYVRQVMETATRMREETDRRNRLLKRDAYRLASDPTHTYVAPSPQEAVPFFNFSPLENARQDVAGAAAAYDKALLAWREGKADLSPEQISELDGLLMQTERSLTSRKGLPGRTWFRHYVYAPGFYTGYGVKTLPMVREAVEQREWKEVDDASRQTAEVLMQFASQVRRAARLLSGSGG